MKLDRRDYEFNKRICFSCPCDLSNKLHWWYVIAGSEGVSLLSFYSRVSILLSGMFKDNGLERVTFVEFE